MNEVELRARVGAALKVLLVEDIALLERDAAERAIAARLAAHLAAQFHDHDVDVEYNRHGIDPKQVILPAECRGGGKKLVVPDIVVHHRGNDTSNLLVVELKKQTNRESRDCDRAKILALKRELLSVRRPDRVAGGCCRRSVTGARGVAVAASERSERC